MVTALDRFRSRKQPPAGVEIVADLDALLEKPIFFKFKGRAYEIRPLSTKDCLRVYAEFVRVKSMSEKENLTGNEIIDTYTDLFRQVCPEFGRREVEQLSPAQLGALYALVIKTITGEAQAEKKTLLTSQGSSGNPTAR